MSGVSSQGNIGYLWQVIETKQARRDGVSIKKRKKDGQQRKLYQRHAQQSFPHAKNLPAQKPVTHPLVISRILYNIIPITGPDSP